MCLLIYFVFYYLHLLFVSFPIHGGFINQRRKLADEFIGKAALICLYKD